MGAKAPKDFGKEAQMKSEEKKRDMFKNWPLMNILIFCPILKKLGENNQLMK